MHVRSFVCIQTSTAMIAQHQQHQYVHIHPKTKQPLNHHRYLPKHRYISLNLYLGAWIFLFLGAHALFSCIVFVCVWVYHVYMHTRWTYYWCGMFWSGFAGATLLSYVIECEIIISVLYWISRSKPVKWQNNVLHLVCVWCGWHTIYFTIGNNSSSNNNKNNRSESF